MPTANPMGRRGLAGARFVSGPGPYFPPPSAPPRISSAAIAAARTPAMIKKVRQLIPDGARSESAAGGDAGGGETDAAGLVAGGGVIEAGARARGGEEGAVTNGFGGSEDGGGLGSGFGLGLGLAGHLTDDGLVGSRFGAPGA